MPLHINNGGSWVTATPYVNDGGTWREAKEVWVNNGGTWQLAHSGLTWSEGPGFYDRYDGETAYFQVTASKNVVWSWSYSDGGAFWWWSSIANGSTSNQVTFSLSRSNASYRQGTIWLTATVDGQSYYWTVNMEVGYG